MPSSLFLSLSNSFLCTWPRLFPHRCSFSFPPLWQLHINHSYIPSKTAFFASLHSVAFSFFHFASLSLRHTFTSPCSLISSSFPTSRQISVYVCATKMVSPFAQLCQVIICRKCCTKSFACSTSGTAENLIYFMRASIQAKNSTAI